MRLTPRPSKTPQTRSESFKILANDLIGNSIVKGKHSGP